MSVLLLQGGAQHRAGETSRWLGCGVVIVALHGAALGYITSRPPIVPMEEPAAIMIELAPLPVAPPSEPVEVAPGPQMMEAPEKVEEEVPPDPLARVEDVPPPPPLPQVEEPLPQVEESPAVNIEVPLPPPMPLALDLTPPERKIEVPKERPKPKPKPIEKKKNEKPPAPRTSAAPAMDAAPSPRLAAPTAGSSSSRSMSPANWRSRLMAHLNRHKRYPSGEDGRGRARVAFTIDRSGRVLSARLAGGSGNARFDDEAVAMVRRASPMPAPPPDIPGGSFSFTVPVDFTQR
ncbi:TonB family protein [Bosea sp. 117]|uniref:energy transducer TonB family protein n=1 Tax=Bosea sp. 117 TaxID=1125973 RepID=UPI0004943150|nr:TonB family protein [Bosea sp. 117]